LPHGDDNLSKDIGDERELSRSRSYPEEKGTDSKDCEERTCFSVERGKLYRETRDVYLGQPKQLVVQAHRGGGPVVD